MLSKSHHKKKSKMAAAKPETVINKAGAIKFNVKCLIAGAEGTEGGKPMRAGFIKCTGTGAGKSVGDALSRAGLF